MYRIRKRKAERVAFQLKEAPTQVTDIVTWGKAKT